MHYEFELTLQLVPATAPLANADYLRLFHSVLQYQTLKQQSEFIVYTTYPGQFEVTGGAR